ncbi:unnamed protein product [Ixodes hexagonus]
MTLLTHQVPSSANIERAKASTVCAMPWTRNGPQDEVMKTAAFPCLMAKLVGANGFKDSKNAPACPAANCRKQRRDSQLSQGRLTAPVDLRPSKVPAAAQPFQMCRSGRSCSASDADREAPSTAPPPSDRPNHKKRSRRRRRPPKSNSKPAANTTDTTQDTSVCVASSPTKTNQDVIVRVGTRPATRIDEKALASSPSPPINSAIAFILGGNDDISDTGSDWDEVDDASTSDCPLDVLVMPLLNGLFSVSVRPRATRVCDEVDGVAPMTSPHVIDANDRWNREYDGADQRAQHRISKVNFGTGDGLLEVYDADDVDRRGPWEQMAIDRKRFQARIASTEAVLAPVFSAEHRQRIYETIHRDSVD